MSRRVFLALVVVTIALLLAPSESTVFGRTQASVTGDSPVIGRSSASPAVGPMALQAQQTLEPSMLAWISSALPDANNGGLGYVWIGRGNGPAQYPGAHQALVSFDLSAIPPADTVTSARLVATVIDSEGADDEFAYYAGRITSPWDEDNVTWNLRPDAWWFDTYTDVRATSGQVSWDATAAVQDRLASPNDYYGIYLRREDDELNPQLHARMLHHLRLVVTHEPMLEISKSDRQDPVPTGSEVEYAIRVTNRGEIDLTNLKVVDTMPPDTRFVAATDGGLHDQGLVSWDLPLLEAGATRAYYLTLQAATGLPGGFVLHNRASASVCAGPRGSFCNVLHETSEDTTVQGLPPSVPTTVPCQVDEAADGFTDATNLQVQQITRTFGRICPEDDEDWFQFDVQSGQTVGAALLQLESDLDLQLWAPTGQGIDTSAGTGLTNEFVRGIATTSGAWRIRVYPHSGETERGTYQLSLFVRTAFPTAPPEPAGDPALEVQTWLEEDYLVPGDTAHYQTRVTNVGTASADNVVLREALPSSVDYVASEPAGDYEDRPTHRTSWSFASLEAGASENVRTTVTVLADAEPGETLWNQADTHADGVDDVHADSRDIVVGEGVTVSPWVVTSPVVPGEHIEVRANVCNLGLDSLANVESRVALGYDFIDVTASPNGVRDSLFNSVTWPLSTLEALECEEVWFTADLATGLAAGSEVVIPWTVYVDSAHQFETDQTIRVSSDLPGLSLSYDLSENELERLETTAVTATVGVATARAEDLLLTFTLSPYLSLDSKHHDCRVDNSYDGSPGMKVVCRLPGDLGEHVRHVRPQLAGNYHDDDLWVRMEVEARGVSAQTATADLEAVSDLTVHGMEVTQGIQTYPGNSVKLVELRKTWVRVHIVSRPGPTSGRDCELRAYRCNGATCDELLGTLQPEPIPDDRIRAREFRTSIDRADGNHEYQFVLPESWMTGSIELEPEVNPQCGTIYGDHDSDCGNNVGDRMRLEFETNRYPRWSRMDGFYRDDHDNQVLPAEDAIDHMLSFVAGSWPLSGFISPHPTTSPSRMALGRYDLTTNDGWLEALTELGQRHLDCRGVNCDYYWVLVLPSFPSEYGSLRWGGLSDGGLNIIVREGEVEDVLAHELGHAFGLDHAGCPDAGWSDAPDNVDPLIPVQIGDFGFNVETRHIYEPDTYDVMSYCYPVWPGLYTYRKVMRESAALSIASSAPEQDGPGIEILGRVSQNGSDGVINAVAVRRLPGGPFDHAGDGPYAIDLVDASGGVLFTRRFTPTMVQPYSSEQSPGAHSSWLFREVLSPQPGLAEIRLTHEGRALDSRQVSANAPQVTLLAPNGGETITGEYTATWIADDLDGDKLTFSLQYSPDDGSSWITITSGLTDTSYGLDPQLLAGTDAARIRVVANDGARTAADESDGSFKVPDHPPIVRISRPDRDERVRQGQTVFLQAQAGDLEDDGVGNAVKWSSDLDGDLGTGAEIGARALSVGSHTITASVMDRVGQAASDSVALTVVADAPAELECTEELHNGSFETAGWGRWRATGDPLPAIVRLDAPSDDHAALLANGSTTRSRGDSALWQAVRLPEGTRTARLSFRYRSESDGTPDDPDYFLAAVLDSSGRLLRVLRRQMGSSDWQTVAADIAEFAGQAIVLRFAVYNDGQGGWTETYVDDVSVCVTRAEPLDDTRAGCWLSGGLTDHAPFGLPDFDQRQRGWTVPDSGQWSHDAPAALADLLWWRDSFVETAPVQPPGASDTHRLVSGYAEWDDHDPRNVPPLVTLLASRLQTNANSPGTGAADLLAGWREHLSATGLSTDYSLAARRSPSLNWVREEVKQQNQVLLLLGFWELQPGGMRRLGGHYVSVAGVGCSGDTIAFSDPYRDAAEAGGRGQVLPDGQHVHLLVPPNKVHNDAANASHDVYGISRSGAAWGPSGYASEYSSVANFTGLNTAPWLVQREAEAYNGGEVITLVDYAVAMAPKSPLVTMALAPASSPVIAGEVFPVQLEVRSGTVPLDRVDAHVEFDPAIVQIVDENGAPATAATPGSRLDSVLANEVDNDIGRVSFVATGDPVRGRFVVAEMLVRAITNTASTSIDLITDGPLRTDVSADGESRLENLVGTTVVAAAGARIGGRAVAQGRSAPPQAALETNILVTLDRPGELGSAYVLGTRTSDTGAFLLPGVFRPGPYRLRVKGAHTLGNLLPTNLTTGLNTIGGGLLLEGDAVADNQINVRDLSLLAAAFGSASGNAGYDARADFSADGIVDVDDVSLLRTNFGRSGDVLVLPQDDGPAISSRQSRWTHSGGIPDADGAGRAAQPGVTRNTPPLHTDRDNGMMSALLATDGVTLSVVPSTTIISGNSQIRIEVLADTGSAAVDAAAVHLDFDPALLSASNVEPCGELPKVFAKRIDNANGHVDIVVSEIGGTAAGGRFCLASMTYRVLSVGEGWVRFSFAKPRETDLVHRGESVLGTVNAGRIRVSEYRLFMPYSID